MPRTPKPGKRPPTRGRPPRRESGAPSPREARARAFRAARDESVREPREPSRGEARTPAGRVRREPPRREPHEPPRRETREAPRRETREPPRREAREAPRREAREPPRREAREAPRGVRREPPRRAGHERPRRETREREPEFARIAGIAAVSAVFAKAPDRVARLFFEARAKQQVAALCATMVATRRPFREVSSEELTRIAGTPMHGGVVALAQPAAIGQLDVQEAERWAHDRTLLLVLDGVGNPHNLGAIIRTAAFFGVRRVVLSDHTSQALPSDASVRVAEGGFEHITVYRAHNLPRMLTRLQGCYQVIGTAAIGGVAPNALRLGGKAAALVLGNEEHGLGRATLEACRYIVTLPGAGAVQSLNVAATAAVLIHALVSA